MHLQSTDGEAGGREKTLLSIEAVLLHSGPSSCGLTCSYPTTSTRPARRCAT